MAVKYPEPNPALMTVAIDFDGVLAENTWPSPKLGKLDREAWHLVRHYFDQGCEVVIFTARPESHHERIWRWLAEAGLFNMVYDVTRIKPQCCLYFDDRAVAWPL